MNLKKSLLAILFGVALLGASSIYGLSAEPGPGYTPGGVEITIGFFYDYLAPFGTWVEFDPYGYVWCPNDLGYGWRPYWDGHWVWTEFGWTWVSDYDWGWAPFHYGRWDWDDNLGWFWDPDIIWGPAWVTWAWDVDFIGWAPLPPDVDFVAGVGISTFSRQLPSKYWSFVEGSHFTDPRVRDYVLPLERTNSIINYQLNRTNITVTNNRVFNGGVAVDEVRRLTGREVPTYRVEDATGPGKLQVGAETVHIYRPMVQKTAADRPKSFLPRNEAPQKLGEIRGQAQRGGAAQTQQSLQENHKKEQQLLEQSQRAEQEKVRRQQEAATQKAANAAEREKVNREAQAKQQEVQKRHAEERAQMQQRHQEEAQNAGQGQAPSSQPKPKKK